MTHALFTGPTSGTVTLGDGTVVDHTPHTIYLDTHEQAKEAAVLISDKVARLQNHPAHDPEQAPFVHDADRSRSNLGLGD